MPRLKLISRSKHDKDNEEKKIYIHGKAYKNRSINLIFKKILELRKLRTEFFETKWKPWVDDCHKVNIFWGKFKKGKRLSGPGIIFEFSEGGYTHNSVEGDFNAQVRIADDDKIPLLIHDPMWKQKAMASMEDRLKGKTKQIIRRQDLVSRYEALSTRNEHSSITLETYIELLYSLLYKEYSDQFINHFNTKQLLIINSNGQDFYFQINDNHFLHLLSDFEILKLQS